MIILDTNVVLEPSRHDADARVLEWLNAQDEDDLWITAITAAELLAGVEKWPPGETRASMQIQVSGILEGDFPTKILPFDLGAALAYAQIAGPRLRSERAIRTMDFQIAAIARVYGATIATRNVADFADCGVELIDPWSA